MEIVLWLVILIGVALIPVIHGLRHYHRSREAAHDGQASSARASILPHGAPDPASYGAVGA